MARKRSKRSKRARARRRAATGDIRSRGRRGGRTAADIVGRARLDRITRKRIGEIAPGGGIRTIGRAALRSSLGRKLLTIARQRLSKIPGIGRFAGRTRRAQTAPTVFGTRAPAARSTRSLAVRTAAPIAVGAATGGAAFEAGRRIFDAIPGGIDVARRIRDRVPARRGGRGQGIPFTPGGIVPTDSITHTWVANGVPFAQLADGRVMVRRKNGTIKTFRRPRPIVLGRNPGVRDIVRADKKIESLLKVMRKRLSPARRPKAPQHSQAHN